jgi:hypothetical protein
MKLEGVIGIGAISLSAVGVATTAEPPPVDPVTLALMILNATSALVMTIAYVTITIRRDRRERDKDTED